MIRKKVWTVSSFFDKKENSIFTGKLVLGLFVISLIILISLVSAYTGIYRSSSSSSSGGFGGGFDIRQGSQDLINFIVDWSEPFLQGLFGGSDYTGYLLFERFLLFLLLLAVIYTSVRKIPAFKDQKWVIWTISLIIPLLAVRFLDFMWLNTIFMQYKLLGIALAGILPFIVYLFFLHTALAEYPIARKIGWIFFIVVYYGLWSTAQEESFAGIYFWTMIVSLLFFLLDGTIHRYLEKQKWNEGEKAWISGAIADIDEELAKFEHPRSGIPESYRKKQVQALLKRRAELVKRVAG
jgi:hypothetical protein